MTKEELELTANYSGICIKQPDLIDKAKKLQLESADVVPHGYSESQKLTLLEAFEIVLQETLGIT